MTSVPGPDHHYLAYLGRLGATNLHGLGREGTDRLERALALQSGCTVLEIGCGTGESLVRFGTRSGIQAHGIDALPDMLRAARLRLRLSGLAGRVGLANANAACGLPFPSQTFDAVYTESVLGIQEPDGAKIFLAEVFRVLKPGGRFVANEGLWKPDTEKHLVLQAQKDGVIQFGFCVASSQGWSLREWTRCMEGAGFSVDSADLLVPRRISRFKRWREAVAGLSLPLAVSMLVTLALSLRRMKPDMFLACRRYERFIETYRVYRPHLEVRLFVLIKPVAGI